MRNLHLVIGLIAVGGIPSAKGALTLNLDFDNFDGGAWSSLYNDAWGGSTSNATKQAAAQAVIEAAADYWETAFASSTRNLTQTIEVGWAPYGGSTLAYGGTWWNGGPDYVPYNGSLTWDNDGTSTFFVDLTPTDNSEWTESSFRTDDLGGGTINAERVFYDAPASSAAGDHFDLLTVAIHEIGHTLGFVGSYPRYTALDEGNDGYLNLSDGTEIGYIDAHLTYQLSSPWGGGPYDPTSMGSLIYSGSRKLLTEIDILTMSNIQSLNNPNTNPLIPEPEPAVVLLFSIALMLMFRRRSQTAQGSV